VGSTDIAGHQRQLDKEISNDISRLNDLLPDDEADKRETWVKLLLFYGESQGWQAPAARTRTFFAVSNLVRICYALSSNDVCGDLCYCPNNSLLRHLRARHLSATPAAVSATTPAAMSATQKKLYFYI
jgi:hypothetical protein